jgi:hypothetical protein
MSWARTGRGRRRALGAASVREGSTGRRRSLGRGECSQLVGLLACSRLTLHPWSRSDWQTVLIIDTETKQRVDEELTSVKFCWSLEWLGDEVRLFSPLMGSDSLVLIRTHCLGPGIRLQNPPRKGFG